MAAHLSLRAKAMEVLGSLEALLAAQAAGAAIAENANGMLSNATMTNPMDQA